MFINVVGLAVGMATCISILIYVDHELSYDDFQKDNVYRIALNRVYPEREVNFAVIPHSVAPQMVEDFPEVIGQTRLFKNNNAASFQYGEKTITEESMVFADSNIFTVMSIELLEGDPKTALTEPNTIVMTESTAMKYFGTTNALGKILEGQGGNAVEVTAIAKDYPKTSHLEFNVLVPLHGFPFFEQPNWTGFSALSYIELAPGASVASVEDKLPALIKQYAEGEIQQRNGISYDEYIAAGNGYNYTLQPIKDIYLTSRLQGEIKPNGNITYIYVFSIAAAFILLIACINFMNLATARSVERAKEVGIRKVLGSEKRQLVMQFLTESILTTLIGAALAVIIAWLFQPAFIQLSGRELSILSFLTPFNMLLLLVLVTFIGILAGLYPAFFISSFSPIGILRGSFKTSDRGVLLRNFLVVLQFTISIALIAATLLIYNQMSYMLNKPLGFEKERVVIIENAFALNNDPQGFNWNRIETFKNELMSMPEVKQAGYASSLPGDPLQGFLVRVPGEGEKESLVTRRIAVDDGFTKTLSMKLVEGRGFSKEFNDSLSVIVNESTVTQLGLSHPIGKKILDINNEETRELKIIGVLADFHFESLHNSVEPMCLMHMSGGQGFVNKFIVSMTGNEIESGLSSMEAKWNEMAPQSPFRYYFLDSSLEQFYESEQASGRLFTVFTVLAIIVACIGLLGLSAFIISQKTKEIGVRKVLGSSVPGIVLLLSKDIFKLIGIASIIATPLTYFWAKDWLEGFAYATGISWTVFVFSGVGALAIAFLTTGFQSMRAARANPVESLRDE